MLNALNNLLLASHALPTSVQVAAAIKLEYLREGGHAGFVTGSLPGKLDWLRDRKLHFFKYEVV